MNYYSREKNINLGRTIESTLIDSIVKDLHSNAHNSTLDNNESGGIYDELSSMGYKMGNNSATLKRLMINNSEVQASIALSCFFKKVINDYNNQRNIIIKQHLNNQIKSLNLKETKNPKFMEDPNGKYYILENNQYIMNENIVTVKSDGSYVIKEKVKGYSNDFLIVQYDIKDSVVALKVINQKNVSYKSKDYVAYSLKLKKEFVKRFKLSGYCGNSSDFFGEFINAIFKPVESGYYVDERYNIFKWNNITAQFEKETRNGIKPGSPLMSDYEVKDTSVIRTDYDGKGLLNNHF